MSRPDFAIVQSVMMRVLIVTVHQKLLRNCKITMRMYPAEPHRQDDDAQQPDDGRGGQPQEPKHARMLPDASLPAR